MNAWIETLPEAVATLDRTREADPEREFERRLADCSTLVYRVALGVLHSPADAEDVAQEAFVRAYRHFSELREPERFRAWLVRVTWRLAIDHLRSGDRRDRRELAARASEVQFRTAEETVLSNEFQSQLEQAVDSLPEKLRRVVILAAVEGYDMRETGALLGLPEGTVRSRLHRARKLLAEKLR